MSGDLFMQAVKDNDAILLPIDSEHNAIFQSMPEQLTRNGASIDSGNALLLAGSRKNSADSLRWAVFK